MSTTIPKGIREWRNAAGQLHCKGDQPAFIGWLGLKCGVQQVLYTGILSVKVNCVNTACNILTPNDFMWIT